MPKIIRSDNGAQFVKADAELRGLWDVLDQDKIKQKYQKSTWIFNPPKASHVGGFFERMVQSAKRSLYATMPASRLDDEQFQTAVAITAGILNARPLGQVATSDPQDPEALTPAHFKCGAPYSDLAGLTGVEKNNYTARWTALQSTMDMFWARFLREIVPQYQAINKWNADKPHLQVGDLVVYLEVKDRGRWPLARVEEVRSTLRDGTPRTITVKFKGNLYQRSAHSVLRLDAISVWEATLPHANHQ